MRIAVLLLLCAVCVRAQELSDTTEPRVAHRAEPEYTKEALNAKIEGAVILTLTIATDGSPSDIKLLQGLGKGLDQKAIECIQQWRFIPATNHGEPVSWKATFEVNFKLPPSPSGR